jgi:hypothetical protein
METRQQGSTLFSSVLVLIATLVVIQLWLLSAAVEALLGHEHGVLMPTAVASAALFLLCAGLLWYVIAFDRRLRDWGSRE